MDKSCPRCRGKLYRDREGDWVCKDHGTVVYTRSVGAAPPLPPLTTSCWACREPTGVLLFRCQNCGQCWACGRLRLGTKEDNKLHHEVYDVEGGTK